MAERHRLDFAVEGSGLQLKKLDALPLTIEWAGPKLVRVAQTKIYDDESFGSFLDPEVVFYIGQKQWIPLSLKAPYHDCCAAALDGGDVVCFDHDKQQEIADYCELWADKLKRERWYPYWF